MLAALRKIPQAFDDVKDGQWNVSAWRGREAAGKVLGIIGCGGRKFEWALNEIDNAKRITSKAIGLNFPLEGMSDKEAESIIEIALASGNNIFTVSGSNRYLRFLTKYGDVCNSILHIAVLECSPAVVKAILEKASELGVVDHLVNYINSFGEPPLFMACFCNKLDTVRVLLEYDAHFEFMVSIRLPNIPYEHLLHIMVFKKHYEIAALLLSRMSESFKNYFPSDTQQTALHISIVAGDRRMTELLIDCDCKVHPDQWDTVISEARARGTGSARPRR